MKKNESGQALILILLSLSVVLTLILYILSRSVTDVAVSGTQEESVRAFSAAEAGVEKALVVGSASQGIGDSSYVANVTNFAQGSQSFNYPISLSAGDTATAWLASRDASGNLTSPGSFNSITVCWGDAATAPAIEVSVYYESTPGNPLTTAANLATIKIARIAFDPNAGRSGASGNNFRTVTGNTCTISGQTYAFQQTITFASFSPAVTSTGLILARVRMLYNSIPQNVGIVLPAGTLPSQGQTITSTGTAGAVSGVGGSNRKISVFQGWPEFPFASNAIFSPDGVIK